jgi:CRISPR/Cas system-associated exonuclease Cas4 (RecB family)
MDVEIKFSQAAFKHGVTEADIRWAFKTVKYDAVVEEKWAVNKHLLIGFDKDANLIEILYNVLDENTVRVFHAMKCRNTYIAMIDY